MCDWAHACSIVRSGLSVSQASGASDTRPAPLLCSQPLRSTSYCATLGRITFRLCSVAALFAGLFHPPTPIPPLHYFHLYTHSLVPVHLHTHCTSGTTDTLLHHPVALASSNFDHSVIGQGSRNRPSAGSLRFCPAPFGCRISSLLSTLEQYTTIRCISIAGAK